MSKKIAVLAVQGAFIEHERALAKLGCECIELRQGPDVEQPYDALVLPGGESTAQAKMLRELGMLDTLKSRVAAGLPVLEAIRHAGLTDCVVVVTRYFGGILLGTGGLVRAYTASATAALEAAQVVTVRACVRCRVTVEYGLYERAMLLISGAGAQAEEPVFTDKVELCFVLPAGQEQPLIPAFRELTRGAAQLECSEPFYTPF